MSSHRGHHYSTAGTSTHAGEDWRTSAACLGADPEIFFPVGTPGNPRYDADAQAAKAICQDRCPVIAECLEDALQAGDGHAIRGGLDPDERKQQFPTPPKPKPKYPCAMCGTGMPAPARKGGWQRQYCSDQCRTQARREQQAAYEQKRKAVAA